MCECDRSEGEVCGECATSCSICERTITPPNLHPLCGMCCATATAAGRYLADWMRCDAPRGAK